MFFIDDIRVKDKLKIQIKLFQNNKKLGLAFSNELLFSKKSQRINYQKKNIPTGKIFSILINNYFISFSTVMVKKSLILKNNINFCKNLNHISDFDFVLKLSRITHVDLVYDVLVKTGYTIIVGNLNFFTEKKFFLKNIKKNNKNFLLKNKRSFIKFEQNLYKEYLLNLIMLKHYTDINRLLIKHKKFFKNKFLNSFLKKKFVINLLSYIIKKKRMYI